MVELNPQQIQDEIIHVINMEKGPYNEWYVGITSNPHLRLFQDHNVEVKDSWWIIKKAKSSEDARSVEKTLIEIYGMDGGGGGGDEKTVYVYAYKKTVTTNP